MKRRSLMAAAATSPLLAALPLTVARAAPTPAGTAGPWRSFELTTTVTLPADSGRTRLWLPVPHDSDYQRLDALTWSGNAPSLGIYKDPATGVQAFHAAWSEGGDARTVSLTAQVSTLDRKTDLHAVTKGTPPDDVAKFLKPNVMITTDGIVKETADKIVAGKRDPLDKAQAIYDWIVENTFRDPKVKGCGIGDIRAMLVSGNLGGKCADLNALFVGLARAAGIPARGVYGIRVAPSAHYPAMGARNVDVSGGQHCRAEFWAAGAGWIPVDPADIRKVVLDDKLALNDPKMPALRRFLFGSWEGNWVAFNHKRDVRLMPGDTVANYFMYPEGDTARGPLDGMDPKAFGYKITARQITA
ncbi:MAG: transglutaminase domain-containing protein [Alphaproteobacteria bacterium]|nr:transglutaminase domain-containing protein [Alphaproteobacteria bacterium]